MNYKKLLISIGIIAAWILVIFLIFYRDNNGLGKGFGIAVIYMITRNVAVVVGAIALLCRISKLMKNNTNILYILTGTLNLSVGIICIVLFVLKQADMQWLNKCLINMLVGFLIIADTMLIKREIKPEREI